MILMFIDMKWNNVRSIIRKNELEKAEFVFLVAVSSKFRN